MVEEAIAAGEIGQVTMASGNLGYELTKIERLMKPELALSYYFFS